MQRVPRLVPREEPRRTRPVPREALRAREVPFPARWVVWRGSVPGALSPSSSMPDWWHLLLIFIDWMIHRKFPF